MSVRKSISTLDYASARIRGHRARLFNQRDYDALLKVKTVAEVKEYLESTNYHDLLTRNALLYEGVELISKSVAQYLRDEYLFAQKFYTEKQDASIRVLGGMLDMADLLTVIRGKYAGASEAEITENFLGPGLCISQTALKTLAKQSSLDDVVSTALTLQIPFVEELRASAERFALSGILSDMEVSLDRAFYTWALAQLRGQSDKKTPARKYLVARIDAQNIMMLARFVKARDELPQDFTIGEFFIEGGDLFETVKKFEKGAQAQTIDDLPRFIPDAHFAQIIREQLPEITLSDSLTSLDKALVSDALQRAIDEGKREIDSVGVSVAYLLALEKEVKNIRLIAHAKSFALEADTVKKALISV